MTKKEMIKQIQVAEAKAWKNLSWVKREFGVMSDQAKKARCSWQSLFDIREQLGIPGMPVAELIANDLMPFPYAEHDAAVEDKQ